MRISFHLWVRSVEGVSQEEEVMDAFHLFLEVLKPEIVSQCVVVRI